MKYKPRIFLSYARPDQRAAELLYERLAREGLNPWMDTKDLAPGQDWRTALMAEIHQASTFLVLLSPNSSDREGFLQEEISEALSVMEQRQEYDIYFFPIRLAPCEIPTRLARYQWIDLFQADGFKKLVIALSVGYAQARLRDDPEIVQENPDLLNTLVEMAKQWAWLDGFHGPKSDPLLDPTDREYIHKFAHLTCGAQTELLARLDAEVPPGSHILFLLQLPEGGETELAEIYRTIVMRNEMEMEGFVDVSKAVYAFIDKMFGKQVQVNVFGCIFALVKYAMSKVRYWDPKLKRFVINLINYIAENSNARVRTNFGNLGVSWEGDLGEIKIVFPDSRPLADIHAQDIHGNKKKSKRAIIPRWEQCNRDDPNWIDGNNIYDCPKCEKRNTGQIMRRNAYRDEDGALIYRYAVRCINCGGHWGAYYKTEPCVAPPDGWTPDPQWYL